MQKISAHTKDRILISALRLFSERGYENVSMRAIADDIGIKAASIYNHYGGKEEILGACFDFYLEHRYDTRLTPEQYRPVIKNGTKEEVLAAINYPFREDIISFVFQAFLIVYSRVYTDERAKDIYECEINNSLLYLEEFFNMGIETGRMEPFNVKAVSLICLSSRLFTAHSAVMKPEDQAKIRDVEVGVFKELVKMIPFNY